MNVPAVEVTEHIGRDHMGMCRFTGSDDIEFKKVSSALSRINNLVATQPTTKAPSLLSEYDKQSLLESLRFEQIDARQMTIKKAHSKTCNWLLAKSEYIEWLDFSRLSEHHGFLWIKGKPGTGKSTMMKFVLANAKKTMKDRIVISFFFNARGDALEKSTTGTYQSLLLQLLERYPALTSVFDTLDISGSINPKKTWAVEALKLLLEQAILSLKDASVMCLIDALDECDERQIRDMVSFFERIGECTSSEGVRFQVCFSSRHYPHITIKNGICLVLEGQEGHTQDITNYLKSELRVGFSDVAEKIRTEINEKASGVFMWVVLVVEILNKEHDNGRIHALRRRLRELPADLYELFRDILIRDANNKDELILCIQWVLFARQQLNVGELYYAILSGAEPDALSQWHPDEITKSDMEHFILSSSKGLTEVTRSKSPKVQFIHESVRDFLLKEKGLGTILPDLEGNFQGWSHDRLKQCCINYMELDVARCLKLDTNHPKASTAEAATLREIVNEAFPFLDYAIRNVLFHSDAAQGCGV